MKATGIVRRIDDLGRVVIPKEIRRTMRIREGDPLEIFTVTLIGGTLMGIIGMIVAVPLYTLVRIIAKEFFWEFKIVRVFTKDI